MTLKQRRIYIVIFILIFFIAAPSVSFYSLGYRLDFKNFKLVKTGGIFINADPKGVDIYIDGKLKKRTSTMPFAQGKLISGLLPGRYLLEVKKENHSNWRKNLEVFSNLVSEARNIFLPISDPEPEAISENTVDFALSPSHALIVYALQNKIILAEALDKEKSGISFAIPPDEKIVKMNFSPDEKYIFIETTLKSKSSYYVINIDSSEIDKIFENTREKYIKISWHPNDSNKLIALTNKNMLYALNIKIQNEKVGLAENVSNFEIFGDLMIYSTLAPIIFYEKNLKSNITNQLIKIPIDYFDFSSKMFRSKGGELSILNNKKELLVYDYENQKFIPIANNINLAIFAPDGKKMLFQNPNEIYVYYLRDIRIQPYKNAGEIELITRFSKPIANSTWLEYDNEHIIFSVDNKIKLVELDGRDIRNIYDLAEVKKPEKIQYNNYDDYIYFLDTQTFKKITLLEGNF